MRGSRSFPGLRPKPFFGGSAGSPEASGGSLARGIRGWFAVVLAIGLLAAAEPAEGVSWRPRVWHANDGLPDNRVTGVVQTPDGSLWVATRGGLVRYNAATFEEFDLAAIPGVIGPGVRAMFSDSRGNLWLGGYREAVIRVGPETAEVFGAANGVPPGQFSELAEDADGRLWFAFGGRVGWFDAGRFRELDLPDGVSATGRASLARDVRGRVWCAAHGRVGVLREGHFEPRVRLEGRDIEIAAAHSGGLWAASGPRIFRIADDDRPVERVSLAAPVRPIALLEDTTGALWIGTSADGLFRYDGRNLEQVETSHRNVGSLLEDREGNLWAGTFGGGLNRLRPRAMDLMGKSAGLPFEAVVSLCQDADGQLCVVAANGQVARGDRTTWNLLPAAEGAACVSADRQGSLWVGTRGQGLRRIGLRDGAVHAWRQEDGMPGNSLRALLVAADDSVWFATNGAVALGHWRQGKIDTLPVPPDVRNIRALVEDARGRIWIGTSDGQVLTVTGNAVVTEPVLAASGVTSVRCLHATPDGALWIGYAERGIGLLKDGRYSRLTAAEGVTDDAIWQISSDRFGALWLAGAHGVCRVDLADALAVAAGRQKRVRSALYGYEQGLPHLQPHYGNAPAVTQTTDGRVLFSTSMGVLALTPQNLRANSVVPPLMLERVKVDDKTVALRGTRFPLRGAANADLVELGRPGATVRLPPEHRKVAIEFAALSYAAAENVRFRHRLDGFDTAWSTPGNERVVTYSRLPAGAYAFRVIASNDAGTWSEEGAALTVVVSPFFWQTWWFRVGLLAGFTALVVAVVRFLSFQRLRSSLRQAEQKAALFQERARIARDIHDDLGGSLAHVKLLSEIAVRDRPATDPDADSLRQITSTTQHMLKSLDETIWAINPRNDVLPNLISYLGQHAVEFLRAAGITCQVDLPDAPPDLAVRSDVRHHVFLVVKEALTNVARHSGARGVALRVSLDGDVLGVVVEDDGRGFAPAPDDPLADGVRNMRQRITSIGGEFKITSGHGTGTRIEFTVPLGVASAPGRTFV